MIRGYWEQAFYHSPGINPGILFFSTHLKEKDILKGIAKFSNIFVKQIMKTRLDVSGIDNKTSFKELIRKVEELHYSRLPVYKDDLDEVIGIINTKDILPYLDNEDDFDWSFLMRQPYFVHENKLIDDLLQEFQTKRIHFAVVVDEFGGTSGIVTLEDILEEVIGEIKDVDFTASRRLQLAVEQSRVTGFIIRQQPRIATINSCVSRWKITSLPAETEEDLPGIVHPRWNVELLKIRNGKPGAWQVTWAAGHFEFGASPVIILTAEENRKIG